MTEGTKKPPAYDNLMMEKLYSKIHDERQCVTSKVVAIEFGVPRSVAADMLEALPYFHTDQHCVYEITRMVTDHESKNFATVKLRKSRLSITSESVPHETNKQVDGAIFSIALVQDTKQGGAGGAPSAMSGNAYSMVMLHDALLSGNTNLLEPIMNPTMACCNIVPSEEIQIVDPIVQRNARIASSLHSSCDDTAPKVNVSSSMAMVHPRREINHAGITTSNANTQHVNQTSSSSVTLPAKKITTASSFFPTSSASVKKTTLADKNVLAGQEKTTLVNKNVLAGQESSKNSLKQSSTSTTIPDEANKMQSHESRKGKQVAMKSQEKRIIMEEKENDFTNHTRNDNTSEIPSRKEEKTMTADTTTSRQIVGTADDFVGDMDEDDDFLQHEKERQQRNHVMEGKRSEAKKRSTGTNQITHVDMSYDRCDDAQEDTDHVTGAMDMFSTKIMPNAGKVGSKRRKQVLEERTYQDENGYLKTETISVWKECDDVTDVKDSSDVGDHSRTIGYSGSSSQVKPSHSTAVVKNTKNMKQAGLMGFLTAKK